MNKKELKTSLPLIDKVGYNERVVGFIKLIVARYYDKPITIYDVKNEKGNGSRKREVINIKHLAVWFCTENVKISQAELGKAFAIDHASVIHIKRKIDGFLTWDVELRKEVIEMQDIINNKGLAKATSMDLEKDFYYIDLNNVVSVKLDREKALVFTGFTDKEVESIMNYIEILPNKKAQRKHKKTGLYILDKLNLPNDEQS